MERIKNNKIVKREEISLGYKCNVRCRFCFYDCSTKSPLRTIDEITKDIRAAKRYGMEHVELSGGEPMLHGGIYSIVKFCKEQGFQTVCMITNGTLLTDMDTVKSLQEAGLNQFVFSLHGADEQAHDYLTRAKTYQDILKAIDNARALGMPFRINVVVTNKNYKELSRIAAMAIALKPIMINYLIYAPLGPAKGAVHAMAARYSQIASEICQAVDMVKDHMQVRVRYFPFCLLTGYERFICNVHQLHYDPFEWDYALREQLNNGLFYKWAKIFVGLFFLPLSRLFTQALNTCFHEALIKAMCLVNSCKPLKCRRCAYYFICDGVWRDYASLYGTAELKPVKGRKITDPAQLMAA